MRTRPHLIAFSLVELSIVLVILGLLTGGILAGQSLIRAAELRALITEYHRFFTATQSFRDKYFAIPGDMATATTFWGKDNTNCSGHTGTAATPGTCNGNGNGQVSAAAAASQTGEMFQFWKQLALAGLIEGSYSGLAGSGGTSHAVLNNNSPASRMNDVLWGVYYTGNYAGDTSNYQLDFGNEFFFGAPTATGFPVAALLKPEEQWNMDTKTDDGKPGTGRFIARDVNGFGSANACTTSTSKTDYAGEYKLSNSSIACMAYYIQQF